MSQTMEQAVGAADERADANSVGLVVIVAKLDLRKTDDWIGLATETEKTEQATLCYWWRDVGIAKVFD